MAHPELIDASFNFNLAYILSKTQAEIIVFFPQIVFLYLQNVLNSQMSWIHKRPFSPDFILSFAIFDERIK